MAKKKDEQDARGQIYEQFKRDLKAGNLGQFYIFCGEEAYLREHYTALLIKKLSDGPAAEFNFHRFTAENFSPEAFADAVEAMPMMADRTLVMLDDVDLFKLPESDRTKMSDIFSDIPEWCCVVLIYDTVAWKLNKQYKKLADAISRHAQIVEFEKQSERNLLDWVAKHFRAAGKEISDKNAQYLLFLTDGSMSMLASEIGKVASYAGGQEIQKSDIDAVVTPVLNAQTFQLSDCAAKGEFDKALRILQDLFAMQVDPLMILGALGSQLRRMHYARMIAGCGKGQETLMELADIRSSYAAGITMQAARRISDEFGRAAVELCLKADRAIKSSRDDPQRVLEILIVQLAGEARRG
ncbi:MAG: DNA polymerase III subunit delta [Clostridia bacterium]|nr:DNA polymerase III subunit delta [Clostridia bacterium]